LFCDLPLHEVILLEAQAVDADARMLRGIESGLSVGCVIAKILRRFGSLPIMVELHDAEESIRRFPAAAARHGWQCLVALENVHVISFGTAAQQ
jgi:PII-like signaling protein